MTEAKQLLRYTALRRLMEGKHPASWRRHHSVWGRWIAQRQAKLPNPALPRVYIAVPVQTVTDVALFPGLLQLLQIRDWLPLLVLVLPDQTSARLAWTEAMLAGWATHLTIITAAEWQAAVPLLPAQARLIQFRCPSSFEIVLGKTELTLDGLVGVCRPAGGVWVGQASDWGTDNTSRVLPDFKEQFEALIQASLVTPEPMIAASEAPASPAAPAENLIRPHSVILTKVSIEDLIAVVTTEGGRSVVAALQPASMGNCNGLATPLPPRFATVAQRPLDIHVLAPSGEGGRCNVTIETRPTAIQSWMLTAYLNRGGAGNPVVGGFARGTGCGLAFAEDELAESAELRSIPVVWGVLRGSDAILERAKAQGLHFYYIDHAYFDRGHGHSYRITRNGYEAGPVRKCKDDRFKKLEVTIEPWRKSGRSIIVCPPTDFFAAAHGCENWLEETLAQLRLETDRPITIRAKPRPGEPVIPLREALEDAHALVTHSSNVAIEAACLGTPVFVAPTSAAAQIGRSDLGMIESPRYPKRDGWLAHLAYSQFSLEEFTSGEAWKIMQMHEGRDYV
jgi:hypothetical protein